MIAAGRFSLRSDLAKQDLAPKSTRPDRVSTYCCLRVRPRLRGSAPALLSALGCNGGVGPSTGTMGFLLAWNKHSHALSFRPHDLLSCHHVTQGIDQRLQQHARSARFFVEATGQIRVEAPYFSALATGPFSDEACV